MATTSNSYTGNNSTVDFAFTFPYLNSTDIKVSLDGVVQTLTTHYTLHNATTIRFGSAPGTGVAIKIYRDTASANLAATFYPGSAIRSSDLNDNYTQNLYVTQEAENDASTALDNSRVLESGAYVSAITKAAAAVTSATTANTTAGNAVTTANAASATASTASSNASAAVVTANAASASVSTVLPYTIVSNATTLQAYFDDSDAATPTIDADDIFELTSTADLPDFIKGATWAQSTAYKVNDQVFVNSKLYRCTVAGTSAGSGSGPSHSSSTATDGTVTWIHEANSDGKWTINSKPDPMPTFSAGITVKLKFASGNSTASVWTWQSYYANNPETRYVAVGSDSNTTYSISCVDGDNSDEEKIRLTAGGSGSGTDDVVLEAGTGLSIARSSDKITFTNTVSDTNTTYSAGTGLGLSSTTFSLDLDTTNEWTKPQIGNIVDNGTHSSGATADFDLDAGNNFKIDINATVELGFSNFDATREGQTGVIYVDNAAITPTWGAEVQFEGGSDGTISITQNAKSVLAYYVIPGGSKVLVTSVLDVKDD